MLKLPNVDFPHYKHLVVDGKIVCQYLGEELLTDEEFRINEYFRNTYNINLEISNYGRIKINNKYRIPTVYMNTFRHGLFVYINSDWTKKPVHRLIKETFDPIFEMDKRERWFMKYEVHHLDNNGNNNKLDNLLWVTREDHRRIDSSFRKELFRRRNEIINKNKSIFSQQNSNI